jgi:iduronate 2-sulfatase
MRTLLLWFGFLTLTLHPLDAQDRQAKPNVLLICVDDLKPTLGCYGDAFAKTPNLDRLAQRAVRFDRAYCNQAVCSPSRNALMVGLRPQTLGIYELSTNFRVARPQAVTLAQYFREHGYSTQALGKIFHVGHGNHEDAASWSVPHFQAKTVQYAKPENNATMSREEAMFSNKMKDLANLPRGAATESAEVPDETYGDGIIAAEAIKRLESVAAAGEPFFMAVGFVKPHLPFVAPKKYWDWYDPQQLPQPTFLQPPANAPNYAATNFGELRNYSTIPDKGPISAELTRHLIHGYYAATSYMDAQLGKLLTTLETTGLHKNTIVVLWGDHGWHLGDHGMWCKHTNYEQATRIPLLVALPGKNGSSSQALVETVDLFPTLAELAGLPKPEGRDGKSFAAVLAKPEQPHRDHTIQVYPRGNRLGRAIRTERYRMVEWKTIGASGASAEFELYDYQVDPAETKNIAADSPEVLKQLQALLATHPEAVPQVKAKSAAKPEKPAK